MKVFKKQETLLENMTYMALMAAINVIFIVLTYFVPFLLFLLLFILPLCSAIISYFCKKRYFPIYFVVVVTICCFIDLGDTIFYVIPAIISGFIFGLAIDFQIPSIYIIAIATVVQFGFTLASIPVIDFFTNRSIVGDIATIFHLNENPHLDYIKYGFIYLISLIQTVLTYIVLASELDRFGIRFNSDSNMKMVSSLVTLSLSLLIIPIAFTIPHLSFFLMYMSFIFMVDCLRCFDYSKTKLLLVESVIILFGTLFFVAGLYKYIDKPLGLLLFAFIPCTVSLAALLNNYLFIQHNVGKMK